MPKLKENLSDKEFEKMRRLYELRLRKLEEEAAFMRFQLKGLNEVLKGRQAWRNNTVSLSWAEFVESYKTKNFALKSALERAIVHKFELGRVWLEGKDFSDWLAMQWARDELKEALFKQYGSKFVIKTWEPGKSKKV